ncbi:non-ribosomal peptide synthetase [Paenibacillus polymyxa]|uniref:non-ribosomal peptide synthetase n=1 Tax=Paenibacillus polymyxa TaxID=1406 RepID=UPI0008FC3892|nr:non-ribosomal peptide synthetase [Paenibacillus polymyxa]APB72093.1 non-ribosomal peptide synthetase [Paenibacillus polymyxa]
MTIHSLFEKQVVANSDRLAVVSCEKYLTYRQLNEKSNQLAEILVEHNVSTGCIVGIMMERSVDMIIAVLAVLKSGGAYLALDPGYPEERVEFMLSDSNVKLLLTQQHLKSPNHPGLSKLTVTEQLYSNCSTNNLERNICSSDLAYLIYTSGSTGQPKGTLLEHKGIENLQSIWANKFHITSKDRIGQFASFSFDASVWEIFMALFNGATLYIIPQEIIHQTLDFESYVLENMITVLTLPPSYAVYLEASRITNLRLMITAGSSSSGNLVNQWIPYTTYVNAYGPTEASICASLWVAPSAFFEGNSVPIGLSLPNTNFYILDEQLKPVDCGEIGELFISGCGLARGYLNRPELTKQKFIQHPTIPETTIYRTGDLVRMLSDGNLEYHGRTDQQVKIRGHRIELEEIEVILLKHKEITEVVVQTIQGEQDQLQLCAYYVARNAINTTELRQFIKQELPIYMIPTYFVYLSELPMTINGKVDRKALPSPTRDLSGQLNHQQPRTDLEKLLCLLMSEVLGVGQVGINDNFYDLGGDSIKAIQLSAKLNSHNLKLSSHHLLKQPTIAQFGQSIQQILRKGDQGKVLGNVRFTPIQHWFFLKKLTDKHHWNQSVLFYNPARYEPEVLFNVLKTLVEHHDALRMTYQMEGGILKQMNMDMNPEVFSFNILNVPPEDEEQFIINQISEIQGSKNLERGPLVHLELFRSKVGDHLLLSIHHLVMDGISLRILIEDLTKSYEQLIEGRQVVLQEKTDSFQRWAEALENYSCSEEVVKQIPYWLDFEARVNQESILWKRELVQRSTQRNKHNLKFALSKENTKWLLGQAHHAYNTDINDVLISALGMALHDWLEIRQIVINMESHGRTDILPDMNITRTVGWFTSQCPVLLCMHDPDDLSEWITKTKENLRTIPNKGLDYEVLKYLSPERLRAPLIFSIEPEINFNYLGQLDQISNSPYFQLSPYSSAASFGPEGLGNISPNNELCYALEITGYIEGDQLHLSIGYDSARISVQEIQHLAEGYEKQLIRIIQHCIDKKEQVRTPSDFTLKNLKEEDLNMIYDVLLNSLNI